MGKNRLKGTNSKCAQCKGECKQFKQVKVIICPNFSEKKDSDNRNKSRV